MLPSIHRNTMCCVDVRTRKGCWERELTVNERYLVPKPKIIVKEIEYNASVNIYAHSLK